MTEPEWPPFYVDSYGQQHNWNDPVQGEDGEVEEGYTYKDWAYDMAEAHACGDIDTWLDRQRLRDGSWADEWEEEDDE